MYKGIFPKVFDLDDIADEPEAINSRNNIGESHKVDSLTDTHGSPREYDVPVQEKHRVLDYQRTQQLPPNDIVECAPQSPLPSPGFNFKERMSRRIVPNLLKSCFSLRLDQLLQSYVEDKNKHPNLTMSGCSNMSNMIPNSRV
ncbi:hypothetical protein Tco_0296516 [Tanacetum coccineum]